MKYRETEGERPSRRAVECARAERLLPALPDGDLPAGEATWLRAHLAGCTSCGREAAAYGGLGDLVRDAMPGPAVLPAGSVVTRRILEHEAARAGWGSFALTWVPGIAIAAASAALVVWLAPQPRTASGPRPVHTHATVAVEEALPALVVIDDERTGRRVLLGPAVSGAASGAAKF